MLYYDDDYCYYYYYYYLLSQPIEIFVDDETKLTLHGLQQVKQS